MTKQYSINLDGAKPTPEELSGPVPSKKHSECDSTPGPEANSTAVASNDAKLIRRARAYLAKFPEAVSGSGGHSRTFAAACVPVEFGLGREQAWPLLLEYNKRCRPPWSEKELQHKLEDAFRRAKPDPEKVKSGINYRPKDGRKEIILPSQHISIIQSAEQIFKLIAPTLTLFNKSGTVVELKTDKGGNPYFSDLKPEEFRTRVEHHGNLVAYRMNKHDQVELRPAKMAVDDSRAMLCSLEVKYLPPISMVARCAIVTEDEDGKLMTLNNGYHRALGGILITQAAPVAEMSVAEAKEALLKLVGEFEFVSKSDRSRNLAARITPALRMGGFLKGPIPVEVMEANEIQAGKGYSHTITTSIYNDTAYFVAQKIGGVGSLDESFAEALISGRPFISFDNVRGNISSAYLESYLTCTGAFFARVPGRRQALVDQGKNILLLTSNGMESTPDLAARSSICRIIKPKDKNGNPIKYQGAPQLAKDHQPYFLGAVHTLIGEWYRQGKPRLDGDGHDFHEWCGVLDWFVQKLLGCAPLMEGHVAVQKRVSDPDLSWMRSLVLRLEETNNLNKPLPAKELVEFCDVYNLTIPGVRVGADTRTALKAFGVRMKKLLGDANKRIVDRHVLSREKLATEGIDDDWKQHWVYTVETVKIQ